MIFMRKTGTYWSWALLGIITELIFLLLVSTKADFKYVYLSNAFVLMIFFVGYRYLIDWNYFNNSVQKQLKYFIVKKSAMQKIFFSMIGGLFVLFSNMNILDKFNNSQVIFLGMISTLAAWLIYDSVREFSLYLMSKKSETKNVSNDLTLSENKSKEVEKVWLNQLTS